MTKDDALNALADAALALSSDTPWDDISLAEIARKAELDLASLYDISNKTDILTAIDKRFDLACSSEPVSLEDTLRDRIFDVAMLRFEAMEDHRSAVHSIRKSWKRNPIQRVKAAKRRVRSANWILTCAEAKFAGNGVSDVIMSGILYRAENAWAEEQGTDFTRTMAQLDRDLRDLSSFSKRVKKWKGRDTSSEDDIGEIVPSASD